MLMRERDTSFNSNLDDGGFGKDFARGIRGPCRVQPTARGEQGSAEWRGNAKEIRSVLKIEYR